MRKVAVEPCEYCPGRVKPSRVTAYWRRGGRMVVIEGVPAGVCDRCGEKYYDALTVRRMEQVVKLRSKARRKLIVPILRFDAVA